MMNNAHRLRAALYLAGGVLLAAGAYAVPAYARTASEDAPALLRAFPYAQTLLYAGALVALVAAVRHADRVAGSTSATGARAGRRRSVSWRWVPGTLALAASAAVAWRATLPLSATEGLALIGVWALAMLLYLAALITFPARRRDRQASARGVATAAWSTGDGGGMEEGAPDAYISDAASTAQGALPTQAAAAAPAAAVRGARRFLRRHGELLAMAAVTLLAGALRMVYLNRVPHILGGDEAAMGWEALEILAGHLTNPFATGWTAHPTLYYYTLALGIRLWPDPIAGLRLVAAVTGTLTVPALYLLARELFDRRVALVAALFLSGHPLAIHISRLSMDNSLDPLTAALSFYLLLVGLRTGRRDAFGLAGLVLGLGQYGYPAGRLIPLVVGAYLAGCVVLQRGFWRAHRGHLLILAGGFLVATLPLLVFWARHPADLLARGSTVSIVQSGWLEREMAATGRTAASLLWQQFSRTVLAYASVPDAGIFYMARRPLLTAVEGVCLAAGLLLSAGRGRRGIALLVLLLGGVLLFGGVLVETPPQAQRLVLSFTPVSLFVAWGLWRLIETAERIVAGRAAWTGPLALAAVTVMAAGGVAFYFGPYTREARYPGLNTEVAHTMGLYLRGRGAVNYDFYGAPRMFANPPNARYLAPQSRGSDVMAPLAVPLPEGFVPAPVSVFLPERLAELDTLRTRVPEGALHRFHDRTGGLLLFAVWERE